MTNNIVSFPKCIRTDCNHRSDLVCVSCLKIVCEEHVRHCNDCQESACKKCYKEDKCCMVQLHGATKRHLDRFYENKFGDFNSFSNIALLNAMGKWKDSPWLQLRVEFGKRSLANFVDRFDDSFIKGNHHGVDMIAQCFPRTEKYLKEDRENFAKFLESIARKNNFMFARILSFSEDREVLLSLTQGYLLGFGFVALASSIVPAIVAHESGKELFKLLKQKDMLGSSWTMTEISHVEAVKWKEEEGVDILQNFSCINPYSVEVIEYLIERNMSLDFLCQNTRGTFKFPMIEMLLRVKGLKEVVEKIPVDKLDLDFMTVRLLRSYQYPFEEYDPIVFMRYSGEELYALICFGVLEMNFLDEIRRAEVIRYITEHDLKACRRMIPYLKPSTRKKIIHVMLCLKRKGFPKDIIFIIIDFAYSPKRETG